MTVKMFVDLDGVLADWCTPAIELMGFDPLQVYAKWDSLDPRPWDLFKVLDISGNEGWKRINQAGEKFWADLPLLPHAYSLMSACKLIGETTVLTSPSQHPGSYAGKVRWLHRNFSKKFAHKHALIGGCKHVVSRPGAVLIDDSPKNCAAWEAEGGTAILFPGRGNDLHTHRERGFAFEYIQPQLEALHRGSR